MNNRNDAFVDASTIDRALGWLLAEDRIEENKCLKTIGFVHNEKLVGKTTEDPKSLSAYIYSVIIEVTKCGERNVVTTDNINNTNRTVDIKSIVNEGLKCFNFGFQNDPYLAVMVFRMLSVYFDNCPSKNQDAQAMLLLQNAIKTIANNKKSKPGKKHTWWQAETMTDVETIEVTGNVLFSLNHFVRAKEKVHGLIHTVYKLILYQS